MNQTTQIELGRRLLAHLEARTTDMAEATARSPVARYTDEERYERELVALFRRGPVAVAHVSELRTPGDYVTRDVAGIPVLLVRGEDGVLRGFLNVCRHRGARLAGAACGRGATAFSCPYHGWSYATDGALRGIPHKGGFPDVDRTRRGLVAVAVTEVAGFAWVIADRAAAGRTPAPELTAFAGDLASFGLPHHVVYAPRRTPRALNWKLAIDIFLEAYHVRVAHADTISPMFFDNISAIDRDGPHIRGVFTKRTLPALREQDPAAWRLREHANILYHLFPNTLVLVQPDHAAVLHILPAGPAHCVMDSYTLVPEPPASERARRYWDANNDILYAATAEDFALGESIQAGFAAGANTELVFGRFEHALGYFHTTVEARVGAG